MPGKCVQFDDETWHALDQLAKERLQDFQELADEAFADLLQNPPRSARQPQRRAPSPLDPAGSDGHSCGCPFGLRESLTFGDISVPGQARMDNLPKVHNQAARFYRGIDKMPAKFASGPRLQWRRTPCPGGSIPADRRCGEVPCESWWRRW
jgi:hypothetical protein